MPTGHATCIEDGRTAGCSPRVEVIAVLARPTGGPAVDGAVLGVTDSGVGDFFVWAGVFAPRCDAITFVAEDGATMLCECEVESIKMRCKLDMKD